VRRKGKASEDRIPSPQEVLGVIKNRALGRREGNIVRKATARSEKSGEGRRKKGEEWCVAA